jgi:hypothetical protein
LSINGNVKVKGDLCFYKEGTTDSYCLQGGSIGVVTYEAKNQRKNLLRILNRRRKIFFIYDVFVKQKIKKRSAYHNSCIWHMRMSTWLKVRVREARPATAAGPTHRYVE